MLLSIECFRLSAGSFEFGRLAGTLLAHKKKTVRESKTRIFLGILKFFFGKPYSNQVKLKMPTIQLCFNFTEK